MHWEKKYWEWQVFEIMSSTKSCDFDNFLSLAFVSATPIMTVFDWFDFKITIIPIHTELDEDVEGH